MTERFGLSEAVVEAALAGDRDQFCALITASQDELVSFVRERFGSREDDVDDTVAATYMRVWELRKTLEASIIRAEVHRMALRVIEAQSRQDQRFQWALRVFRWLPWVAESGEDQRRHELDHMMRLMDPAVATVVELKYVYGLELGQVADLLGLQVHEVQFRLRTGRDLLRSRAKAEGWDESTQ